MGKERRRGHNQGCFLRRADDAAAVRFYFVSAKAGYFHAQAIRKRYNYCGRCVYVYAGGKGYVPCGSACGSDIC